jgi:hypothetical protein
MNPINSQTNLQAVFNFILQHDCNKGKIRAEIFIGKFHRSIGIVTLQKYVN